VHSLIDGNEPVLSRMMILFRRESENTINFLRVEVTRLFLNTSKCIFEGLPTLPKPQLITNNIPVIMTALRVPLIKVAAVIIDAPTFLTASLELGSSRLKHVKMRIQMTPTRAGPTQILPLTGKSNHS